MSNLKQFRLGCIALGLAALMTTGCDRKGPAEQLGEEVDEAVDTMKRGEESTTNKLDDAMDEARDAVDEVTE